MRPCDFKVSLVRGASKVCVCVCVCVCVSQGGAGQRGPAQHPGAGRLEGVQADAGGGGAVQCHAEGRLQALRLRLGGLNTNTHTPAYTHTPTHTPTYRHTRTSVVFWSGSVFLDVRAAQRKLV